MILVLCSRKIFSSEIPNRAVKFCRTIPENIHTNPLEGYWKFWGSGVTKPENVKVHLTPKFFFRLKKSSCFGDYFFENIFGFSQIREFYAPLKSSSEWTTTA